MTEVVTKGDWLAAEECWAQAWLGLRATSTALSEAELFRMEQGQEVGRLAQELWPNGVLVSKKDGQTRADITQRLISNTSIETLFEA